VGCNEECPLTDMQHARVKTTDVKASPNFLFLSSVSGRIGPALHEQSDEEDCSQRRLFRTLPGHPAKLHEGHSCCQHQLCGLRIHEDRLRDFLMMLQANEKEQLFVRLEHA